MSSLNKYVSARMAQKTLESEISGEEVKEIQSMSIELIERHSSHSNFSSTKEKKMRFCFALALTAVLLAGAVATAAPIVSDNFNTTTIQPQWNRVYSYSKGIAQTDGAVNIWVGGNVNSWAGYDPTPGYVLSGDFDISIDFNTTSFSHGVDSMLVGALYVRQVGAPTVGFTVQNRSIATEDGGQWYMGSLISGDFVKHKNVRSEDVTMRLVRTGSDIAIYGKTLGAEEWTLLRSGTFTTSDLDVSFRVMGLNTQTAGDLKVQMDNFTVPEPASIMVFCSAAALMIRKRRMA